MSDVTPTPSDDAAAGSQPPATPTPPSYPSAPDTPPPPSYPAGAAPAAMPQNGLGLTALIMGILQFVCLGPIGSILAIVFGILGRNKAKKGLANNKGVATAGLVLGIVGLVLSIIGGIILVGVVGWGAAKVAETVDPANNAKTGLVDGDYLMEPDGYLWLNSRCSFSGPVVDAVGSSVGSVTVVGESAAQCGSGNATPDAVVFTVSGGVAAIVEVVE